MLDKLVDTYVRQAQKNLGLEEAQDAEAVEEMKDMVYQQVSKEVLRCYEEDLIQKMRQRVDQEETQRRQAWRRKTLVEVIVDAVFLATLIGLTVNQVTNLMEQIRLALGFGPVATPIVLILLLAIVIFLFAIVRLGLHQREEGGLE